MQSTKFQIEFYQQKIHLERIAFELHHTHEQTFNENKLKKESNYQPNLKLINRKQNTLRDLRLHCTTRKT